MPVIKPGTLGAAQIHFYNSPVTFSSLNALSIADTDLRSTSCGDARDTGRIPLAKLRRPKSVKQLLSTLTIILALVSGTAVYGQIVRPGTAPASPSSSRSAEIRPKGWDGKIQGLFNNDIAFIHLNGPGDYAVIADIVLGSFNRNSTNARWTLGGKPEVRSFKEGRSLVIKAESKQGRKTAFFPVTSEGPQGIILATNGSICNAGNECGECSPNILTQTCTCSDEVNPSPNAKCQYGGKLVLTIDTRALEKLTAVTVGTIGRDGAAVIDPEKIAAEVRNTVPPGFEIGTTEVKAVEREQYALTSLRSREGKSYLFISKLVAQNNKLSFRYWGFLYHCEGICGISVAQCEAKSPSIALNGQLSCGCNGHCAPHYGFVPRRYEEVRLIEAISIYP